MSATSITPKTRDSIFDRILVEFLKGGRDYILDKEFALGKGWSKEHKHFQYLYLNLLCNFSCSIDYYFNQKLKQLTQVNCETKINLNDIKSPLVIKKTDNVLVLECLIKDIIFNSSTDYN